MEPTPISRSAYPPPPDAASYQEFLLRCTGEGTLKIQAARAHRALPTAGVEIYVLQQFSDQRVLFFRGRTDADGLIDNIVLPSPPRSDFLRPQAPRRGALYQVFAVHPAFLPASYEAEIFPGVTAILPVVLQLPEGEGPWQ